MCIIISTTINDQPYGGDYIFFYLTSLCYKNYSEIFTFELETSSSPPVVALHFDGISLFSGFASVCKRLFAFSAMIFFVLQQWNSHCHLHPFHHLPSCPQKPKVKLLSRGNWILQEFLPCRAKSSSIFAFPHEIQVSFLTWMHPFVKVLWALVKFSLLVC